MAKTFKTVLCGVEYETATKGRVRIVIRNEAGLRNRATGKEYLFYGGRTEVMAYRLPNGNYIYAAPNGEVIEVVRGVHVERY